LEGPHPAT